MPLNFQILFHQFKASKIHILLISIGIIFLITMGIVAGYFYYLSP